MKRAVILALACAAVFSAVAARKTDEARQFQQEISNADRIAQALNRLTFGPRPGDTERAKVVGLKKWIDRELHPESIPENPVLLEKLKALKTLNLSSEDLAGAAASRQLQNRARKKGQETGEPSSIAPRQQAMRGLLTPQERNELRDGTPDQRRSVLQSLSPEKREAMMAAIRDMRGQGDSNGPQRVARDLGEAKLLRAIYSTRQLNELLVDFWFNHFNVYLNKGAGRFLVTAYERDAIRPHVLGKFHDLLEATARHPAMLFYLDNWQSAGEDSLLLRRAAGNRPRGLNENYGRELLELHTLGVDGGYTQKDVTETARCFTGWTILQPRQGGGFFFAPRMHDRGEKVLLGVTIPAGGGIEDGLKVLDILARHPSTARHISRRLAQRFVADDPPAVLVDRMAQSFLKTGGDLREVMKTMIESSEFWSVGAYRSKVKSPFEMVVSAIRAADAEVDNAFGLTNQVAQLGQPLYRKQEPTGYSNSSQEWLNSASLVARMNFALQLADGRLPGVKAGHTAGASIGSPDFQLH